MARLIGTLLLFTIVVLCTFFLAASWLLLSSSVTGYLGRGVTDDSRSAEILQTLQEELRQCVAANGLGLEAEVKGPCQLLLKYPRGTNSTWFNKQFKVYEPLDYAFNVCDTLLLWEQYRNMTTILTREYLDARPNGWLEYAPTRISQFAVDRCCNRSLCEELQLVLPAKPPFKPRQFSTCAVVGNSGDLLLKDFGSEIDAHDAVFRDNEAPVNETYEKYVGHKRTFRLIGEGVARNLQEVVKGNGEEVLIIKSKVHRDFNAMIKEIPNPVYLFQGVEFRRGAKGTGIKSIELAVSMCDAVDIYGFTVDPGYADWTRYFSERRRGHNPLQGRAYYQLLECLGVIRIHSPMREEWKQDWSAVPRRQLLVRARAAAFRLKKLSANVELDPYAACGVWATARRKAGPLSGASDMSSVRKTSNYSRWEQLHVTGLRRQAQQHQAQVGGVSFYKMDGNKLDNLLCVRPG